jgi:hypothetical protein
MDLGDLSILGREIGEKQDWLEASKGIDFKRNPAWCLAYGRDSGETNTGALSHASLQGLLLYFNGSDCDYLYVFNGYGWSYTTKRPKTTGLYRKDLVPIAQYYIEEKNTA